VGATLQALDRLRVLMIEDFPTLGCPTRPMVREVLMVEAEVEGPEDWLRNPLINSRRGFVEEPEAD